MIFNNREQKGIAVFIALILGFVLFKASRDLKITSSLEKEVVMNDIKTIKLAELIDTVNNNNYSKKIKTTIKNKQYSKSKSNKRNSRVFDFNPNKISKDSLIMLGISNKTAYNWTKYIEKGGIFKTKKDIKKIYGMTETLYKKLKNNILLPDTLHRKKYYTNFKSKNDNNNISNKTHKDIIIELNICNAGELIKLRGIGEVLSKRIIKFRNKLGGFTSKEQLKEVYGLPIETYDEIKNKITVNKGLIKKLKINIGDKDTLVSFPYFNYRLASQIINYRNQHGYFKNIEDLKQIRSIDSTKIKKIEPYLDFELN